MKWFDDRKKTNKMLKMSESINSIRSQQVMQWLELIHTSIEGLREIGSPKTEADRINHATFMRIFNESIVELQEYVERFEVPEEICDYTLLVSDKVLSDNSNVTKEVVPNVTKEILPGNTISLYSNGDVETDAKEN